MEKGVSPNYFHDGKNTPLCRVCYQLDIIGISVLADSGADPEMCGKLGLPISYIDAAIDTFEYIDEGMIISARAHFLDAFGYPPDDIIYQRKNGSTIRFNPQDYGVEFLRSRVSDRQRIDQQAGLMEIGNFTIKRP